MNLFSAIFLAFVCVPVIFAGTETVSVKGFYDIDLKSEVSPREALDRAYKFAKAEALQKVVGVRVQSWETLVNTSKKGDVLSSLSLQTTQGIIRKFSIKNQGWEFEDPKNPNSDLRVFCEADVTVEKIDAEPDTEFQCKISGMQADFLEGESARVSIVSTKDSYLTVFLLDARLGGVKVFPNRTFKKNKIDADEKFSLRPMTIFRTTEGDADEHGFLMFVLTKKNVPFIVPANGKTTSDEINKWLADIPADERFFSVFPFIVQKNGEIE